MEFEKEERTIMIEKIHIKERSMRFFMLFIFNLFWCLLSLGAFVFNKHFSVDDYWIYYDQKGASLTDVQQNMRMFSGSLYYLLDRWGVNIVEQQIFFGVILLITFAWVTTRISMEIADAVNIQENVGKIILADGGTLILFLNAAVSEYLYYSGVYVQWIIGIIGLTYGAICISREKRVVINWLVGTAALIIMAGSYQTFLAQYAYVVMALIFIRNAGKANRKTIMANVRAIAAAAVAMGVNMIGIKMLAYCGIIGEDSRMSLDLMKIPELVGDIIRSQKSIWFEGMGIYPKGILALLAVFFLGILLVVLCKRKAKIEEWIYLIIVLVSGSCVMYAAQIMQGFIRVTNRGMYAIFGIYAVSIWVICYYLRDADWKVIKRVNICVISIFLVYSSIQVNRIAIDVFMTNTLSRCYVEEINRRIINYENQNSIQVMKVGFCSDAFISYRYNRFIETTAYGDMCANPFLADWSSVSSLNYYTGRALELVSVPDYIVEYYAEFNWDEADWDKQLVFDSDAVYICVF